MKRRARKYSSTRATTFLELIIATGVASLVFVFVAFLLVHIQKSIVVGQATESVRQNASYGMDWIVSKLRGASRNYGLVFADEVTGYPGQYRKVSFYPSEEEIEAIYFDPESGEIRFQPSASIPDYEVIARVIGDCRFFIDPPDDLNELEIIVVAEKVVRGRLYQFFTYNSAHLRAP